jgi:uncharacterized protein (DUF924 family)
MKLREIEMHTPEAVLTFWFVTHDEDDWFGARPEFDAELAGAFTATHAWVAAGNAVAWRTSPSGRLAEIIVLDQFSRQLFRKRPEAYATDPMALGLARELVATGGDLTLEPRRRMFAYLPFMHSEDLKVHEEAAPLFAAFGDDKFSDFERRHIETLERFGRYPYRNEALGRTSTAEEIEYMKSGNGMF